MNTLNIGSSRLLPTVTRLAVLALLAGAPANLLAQDGEKTGDGFLPPGVKPAGKDAKTPFKLAQIEAQKEIDKAREGRPDPDSVVIYEPSEAGTDFLMSGEYVGMLKTPRGELEHGVQVIAVGDGQFHAEIFRGGLPGAGWRGKTPASVEGTWNGDIIEMRDIKKVAPFEKDGTGQKITGRKGQFIGRKFEGLERNPSRSLGAQAKSKKGEEEKAGRNARERLLTIHKDGSMEFVEEGEHLGTLRKVERSSPSMGQAAPENAVVLFDGNGTEALENGKIVLDNLLQGGCKSKQAFQDHSAHLEFRLPYMPFAMGWKRAPGGVIVQGRYEIAILDSIGRSTGDHGNGGLPGVARQSVNMSLPPLAWQTLDYEFRAARFDEAGEKTENARITVKMNGVVIHEDVELDRSKRFRGYKLKPFDEAPSPGPLELEGSSRVVYRNIWVVPGS